MIVIDDQLRRSVKAIIEAVYSRINIVSLDTINESCSSALLKVSMSKLRTFIASCIHFDIDIGKG